MTKSKTQWRFITLHQVAPIGTYEVLINPDNILYMDSFMLGDDTAKSTIYFINGSHIDVKEHMYTIEDALLNRNQ